MRIQKLETISLNADISVCTIKSIGNQAIEAGVLDIDVDAQGKVKRIYLDTKISKEDDEGLELLLSRETVAVRYYGCYTTEIAFSRPLNLLEQGPL
jgi:hypothetical protein